MYIDSQNSLCLFTSAGLTPQAETTVAAHISANVIDLIHNPRVIIENPYFVFQCAVVPVSAGGGTLQIDLVTSAAAALTAPQVLWSSGILANADIVAWVANTTIFAFRMPARMNLQYLGAIYTIATAVFTAGSWRAFFAPDVPFLIAATP